eukprot:1314800-Prymnesium_polylepis.1
MQAARAAPKSARDADPFTKNPMPKLGRSEEQLRGECVLQCTQSCRALQLTPLQSQSPPAHRAGVP